MIGSSKKEDFNVNFKNSRKENSKTLFNVALIKIKVEIVLKKSTALYKREEFINENFDEFR